MPHVSSKVQIHMPFHYLHDRYLPMVLERRLNPEISFDVAALERFRSEDYRRIGDQLRDAGLCVTFHAPFMDLRPGAIDPQIRQISIDRIRRVLDLASFFHPISIVCHPSFDHRYYVSTEDVWLQNSIDTWTFLGHIAADLDAAICLENVYEKSPHILKRLLGSCDSRYLRFCFDAGHFNVFSGTSLEEWIQVLSPYLFQLHLHDNGRQADEHLAIGDGSFPFRRLFSLLRDQNIRPVITLEAHREEILWRSLQNLEDMSVI